MKKYEFKAKIEGAGGSGGAYVLFPFDVKKEFGTGGRIPVKAAFDGVAYTGTMVKYGHPQHMLPVLKAVREKIGRNIGDTIDVVVRRDEAVRTIETPAEFAKAMKKTGVLEGFKKLSYTHQKEYVRWITEAKKEETRVRRVEKALEMLKEGVKTPDGKKG